MYIDNDTEDMGNYVLLLLKGMKRKMFNNERISLIYDTDKSVRVKDKIIKLLKEENISISQARWLFINIVGTLEDTPIGSNDL